MCHGVCHSSRPGKRSNSSSGIPEAIRRSAGVPFSPGCHSPVRYVRSLLDHHAAPGLVDVGALADQPGVGAHRVLAAAGHDHDLDPGPVACLERPRLAQGEVALGVAQEGAPPSEQGPVEVGVDAAQRHARTNLVTVDGLATRTRHALVPTGARGRDRQRHRRLVLRRRPQRDARARRRRRPRPRRCRFRAARRRRGRRSQRPAGDRGRRGRAARARDRAAGRGGGRAGDRRHVLSTGRGPGARRRRRGDQRHRGRRAGDARADRRAGLRLRAHAHRGPAARRSACAPLRRRGRAPAGLVCRAARAGRGPRGRGGADRARPGPRLRPLDRRRHPRSSAAWASSASLGRPLFVALSRKDFLGAIAAGSWERRLEPTERGPATMAAAALAAAAGAEVLRLHDAEALDAMRTAARSPGRPTRSPKDEARPADVEAADFMTGLADAPPLAWERLLEAGDRDERLVTTSVEPARGPRTVEAPAALSGPLAAALRRAGITELYSHQVEALEASRDGDVIVTSGTASGKSLSFNLPVLDAIAADPKTRALYIYPTKALAQDQARKLSELALPELRHAIYDGDTPARRPTRDSQALEPGSHQPGHAEHGAARPPQGLGRLPRQPRLGGGRRGAHLPRRLRLARRQRPPPPAPGRAGLRLRAAVHLRLGDDRQPGRARPRACRDRVRARRLRRSAARQAPDRDLEPAGDRPEDDASPLGALGGRRAARRPGRERLADDLLPQEPPWDRADPALHPDAPARSSASPGSPRGSRPTAPATRRSSGGRSRPTSRGASCSRSSPPTRSSSESTSASSTPRSASPSRARSPACGRCGAGRAGAARGSPSTSPARTRSTSSSAATRTSSSRGRSRRRSSTTPTSGSRPPTCWPPPTRRRSAAPTAQPGGADDAILGDRWRERADALVAAGQLRRGRDGRYLPRGPGYPGGRDLAALRVARLDRGRRPLLGRADRAGRGRACLLRPSIPGAIYLHLGRSYEVAELDIDARRAIVDPFDGDWYTQPKKETEVFIESVGEPARDRRRAPRAPVELCFGEVSVTEQVIAYQRKSLADHSVIDLIGLELPEQNFPTQALWYLLGDELAGPSGAAAGGPARRAARDRAQPDRGPAAAGDVRPLGHRRALDQHPLPDRAADDLHLRRPPRRGRDLPARLRRVRAPGRRRGPPGRRVPVRGRLPVVRAEPQVREPERAAAQAAARSSSWTRSST